MRHFHVGIYARLSSEGTEQKNESIDIQIAIAKQYLKEHPEMELYNCYIDLGKTGTNFNREGFKQMMQDVRKKRIDCIIVKDLSRFGRDHIETGNYIHKIFPFMGVRFIALTDRIDTFMPKSGTDEMTINLKNLVNEMYAKDIAEKVRSSKHSSQEQGSYTGGVLPYGYQAEWINGKRCLFICQKTSVIVKDIYELFLSGKNMRQIAEVLYKKGIHRPSIYRETGHVYFQEGELLKQWPTGTIKLILTNPVYMGCLVHGTNIGDYCIQHKTHEPLVSEDVFFRVAAIFERSAAKCHNRNDFCKKVPLEDDIYAGVLFCGDCGKRMTRTANTKQLSSGNMVRHYGYFCPTSRRIDDWQCPAKSISINVLDKLVKTALRQEFALLDFRPSRLTKKYNTLAKQQKQQIRQEIVQCEKQQEFRKRRGSEIYLEYYTCNLSLEKFKQMKKENERSFHKMSEKKEKLQQKLEVMEQEIRENRKFMLNLMKCNEKTKLTKDVIHTLISRIDIYDDHRVKITCAFHMNHLLMK